MIDCQKIPLFYADGAAMRELQRIWNQSNAEKRMLIEYEAKKFIIEMTRFIETGRVDESREL